MKVLIIATAPLDRTEDFLGSLRGENEIHLLVHEGRAAYFAGKYRPLTYPAGRLNWFTIFSCPEIMKHNFDRIYYLSPGDDRYKNVESFIFRLKARTCYLVRGSEIIEITRGRLFESFLYQVFLCGFLSVGYYLLLEISWRCVWGFCYIRRKLFRL